MKSKSKLVIISHTGHQMHPEYGPVGWGPTIREVNFMAQHWDEVVHVACLERGKPEGSSLPYAQTNIHFEPIPAFGGARWWQKLDIIYKAPKVLLTVHRALRGATEVQIRLPMSMGVFLMPYFKWVATRSFRLWVKYATNWGQPSRAASYRWQQRWLNNNWLNCPVTINGEWPNQPQHCKTFENPCLTGEQYNQGERVALQKALNPPYTLIFIGRVDADKGVDLLMESMTEWPITDIAKMHIVGDGPLLEAWKNKFVDSGIAAVFHGFITQEAIFRLLAESHFLLLPSRSEGFPKVVAEALNFGCVPIVSGVGSIPYYIREGETGILISALKGQSVATALTRAAHTGVAKHQQMMQAGRHLARRFTFEAYFQLLQKAVLNAF